MKFEQALLGKVFLIIFACIFIQVIYKCVITTPSEGDSVDYHIPIAKSFISGNIINPAHNLAVKHTKYYPGNTEALLSVFYLEGIPLGLFNAFGILTLLFICIRLGIIFRLNIHTSIIFAVTVCTLNAILRWADTQIADIWLLNFFLLSLIFLEKPKKSAKYFLKLGLALGLLIGSKYSAPFIAIILLIFYAKKILPFVNISRMFSFLIPISIFGFSWYLRNILLTGNPLYPQAFLFFKGGQSAILNLTVAKVITGSLNGLLSTLNSFVSEFLAWSLIIPGVIIQYFRTKETRKFKLPFRLIFLAFVLTLFFINLPSANQTHIMTSSFRYFLSALVPAILFVFIYFDKIKKVELLSVTSLASLLLVEFPLGYYPKLFIATIPVGLIIYIWGYKFICEKLEKRFLL